MNQIAWLSRAERNACGSRACAALATEWKTAAETGATWQEMVSRECEQCNAERQRRNRLIEPKDERIKERPFIDAPYIHQHNEPKYHARLLRAVEHAKRGGVTPAHILWVVAQDEPVNPAEIASNLTQMQRKQQRWLQYHDQMTAGISMRLSLFHQTKDQIQAPTTTTLALYMSM